MNGLALCAGAGGLELGLHLAEPGYRTVGFVEREARAAASLVARMADSPLGEAPVWDDLGTFDGRRWRGCVDIVSAGFPCQPFSVAGQQRGIEDERHLWPDVARVTGEVCPAWVLLENVPGLATTIAPDGRSALETVCDDLQELGFAVAWDEFSAAEVGASHLRERIFIVAHAAGGRHGDDGCAPGSAGHAAFGGEHVAHTGRRGTNGIQPERQRRGSKPTPAGGGGEHVAHAEHAERRAEHEEHAHAHRGHGPRRGGGDVGDAFGGGRDRWPHDVRRRSEWGAPAAGASRDSLVAHADSWDGRQDHSPHAGRASEQPESGGRERLPAFPPGRNEYDRWRAILAEYPWLAPSLEPGLRGVADGLAHRLERSRLALTGNGVVPLVAAHAWLALRTRLEVTE